MPRSPRRAALAAHTDAFVARVVAETPAPRPSRYTPPRPWAPLTDAEWAALAPFVERPPGRAGRPMAMGGPRARLDACFRAAVEGTPWTRMPGGGALARQFRRWAQAGLWTRLLKVAARRRGAPAVFRGLEHRICAAFRRATRVMGLPAIALARRLGMLSALNGPPWLLPNPELSQVVGEAIAERMARLPAERPTRRLVRLWRRLLGLLGGRRGIPRGLRPA